MNDMYGRRGLAFMVLPLPCPRGNSLTAERVSAPFLQAQSSLAKEKVRVFLPNEKRPLRR